MQSPELLNALAGNALIDGMEPYAMCYGGHQFGNWAGQLGDGRAIGLGEVEHNGAFTELQLKGAVQHLILEWAMAELCSGLPSENIFVPRPCMDCVYQPQDHYRWC